MSPETAAALAHWEARPAILVELAVVGIVYARGFVRLHRQMPRRFPRGRLAAFIAGLAILWLAVASPLDAFADLLLSVHMVQHVLLLFVAPPLILLGAPAIPIVRGIPPVIAKTVLRPILKSPAVKALYRLLTHPIAGWCALTLAIWTWHAPAPFQIALRSETWHAVEHGCFVTAAMLFWWPVTQPWPSANRWPRWAIIPYLLLADVQNSMLSAVLTFSDRLIYPFYANVPRVVRVSALDDQVAAGVIMWVPASLFFVLPAVAILLHLLEPRHLAGKAGVKIEAAPIREATT